MTTKILKMILSISAVSIAVWLLLFFSDEWNRAGIGSKGRIEEGSKLGLEIGDSREIVHSKLGRRGIIDTTLWGKNEAHYNRQRCHGAIYPDNYVVESWWDNTWRKGVICVVFMDENLVSMSWNFNMLTP
jgi:hypothetical protein